MSVKTAPLKGLGRISGLFANVRRLARCQIRKMPQIPLNTPFTFSFLWRWYDANQQSSFTPLQCVILTSLFLECCLSCWCELCSSLPLALSTAHVMCNFMYWFTDSHAHACVRAHTHAFILKTDICSEVSVAWICGPISFLSFIKLFMCGSACACACGDGAFFKSPQITVTAPEDSEKMLELSTILMLPRASFNPLHCWD